MTNTTEDPLAYWRAMLDGADFMLTEDPECGFYRGSWYKDSGVVPIAIWRDDDNEQRCLVGYSAESNKEPKAFFAKPETLAERWTFFCQDVIPYELYASHFASGEPWPEEATVDAPKFDHNQPPEGLELHKQNLTALIEAVRQHLKIEKEKWDKAWGDKTGNYRSKLLKIKKEIDDERTEKKKPHMAAANAIQAEYKPVIDQAEKWNGLCKTGLDSWKAEEDRKAKEALVAEAQAVAAGEKTIEEMEVPKQAQSVGGKRTGGTGRATAFRTVRRAKITNYKKALEHFSQDERIVNMVQALCDAQARAGEDKGPGWVVEETQHAS